MSSKCAVSRRKKAPGMARSRRGKLSYFGMQLREKQKTKRFYYVSEMQFEKYYEKAAKSDGNTGNLLLQYLERRLDNVVYRLGFTSSRIQARQMIGHGHFSLNGKKAKTPAIQINKGDVIKINDKSKNVPVIQANLERETTLPNWLEKTDDYTGKVMEYPTREEITDIPIKEQMIIELYSK
jgi:small subunit ribosomal protein S4